MTHLRELTGIWKLESQAGSPAVTARCSRRADQAAPALVPAPPRRGRAGGRVGQAVVAAVAALESSADLRRTEAELEAVRQTHYEANDALHAAQGALGQAALEVSRLEERIRYVAAGRERLVRQRAELEAQSATWRSRESDAGAEHARLGGEIEAAERAAESLAGELATHASRVAELEGTLREAQARSSAERGAVATVQQQIQVSAAEARASTND
jgi:chromosome segregation protein